MVVEQNLEQITELNKRLETLANEFITIYDQERQNGITKKSIILEMADIYHQLFEKGTYKLPLYTVCHSIINYLGRKGYNVSDDYVHRVLRNNAPQYTFERSFIEKRQQLQQTAENAESYEIATTSLNDRKIVNQKYKEALDFILETNHELIDRSIFQEYTPRVDQWVGQTYDYSRENDILIPHFNENEPHYQSPDNDPFKDTIRTDKPEYRENSLGFACKEYGYELEQSGKLWQRVGDNVHQFSFDTSQEEQKKLEESFTYQLKQASKVERLKQQVIKPLTDLKFKRTISEWFNIVDSYDDHGIHAASSKNPGIGKYKNPETGEIVEQERKLTREHIDDKVDTIKNFGILLKKMFPFEVMMEKWYTMRMKDWAIGQSIKLGPKLSDKKFK